MLTWGRDAWRWIAWNVRAYAWRWFGPKFFCPRCGLRMRAMWGGPFWKCDQCGWCITDKGIARMRGTGPAWAFGKRKGRRAECKPHGGPEAETQHAGTVVSPGTVDRHGKLIDNPPASPHIPGADRSSATPKGGRPTMPKASRADATYVNGHGSIRVIPLKWFGWAVAVMMSPIGFTFVDGLLHKRAVGHPVITERVSAIVTSEAEFHDTVGAELAAIQILLTKVDTAVAVLKARSDNSPGG